MTGGEEAGRGRVVPLPGVDLSAPPPPSEWPEMPTCPVDGCGMYLLSEDAVHSELRRSWDAMALARFNRGELCALSHLRGRGACLGSPTSLTVVPHRGDPRTDDGPCEFWDHHHAPGTHWFSGDLVRGYFRCETDHANAERAKRHERATRAAQRTRLVADDAAVTLALAELAARDASVVRAAGLEGAMPRGYLERCRSAARRKGELARRSR